jgi:hypothetical protein
MGVIAGANINDNGLVFSLDAANFRSYSGSGLTSFGLVGGISGTLVNGVGFTSTNGGSFIFDGTNDYIDLGSSIQNYSVFTTSFWINYIFFDAPNNSPLGDNSQEYSYHIVFSNGVFALGFSSSFSGNPFIFTNHNTININTWYNFVVSKNSSDNVSFYQNAVLLETLYKPGATNIHKIGAGNVYDNAKISNVSFYNRALTAKEIKQNYNATKKRYGL